MTQENITKKIKHAEITALYIEIYIELYIETMRKVQCLIKPVDSIIYTPSL